MKYMPLSSPYGYTIFCDDIRQEVGNKLSIIGIYSNGMITSEPFPLVLPKFCMYVNYMEVKGTENDPVSFLVFLPGDDEKNPTYRHDHEDIENLRKNATDAPVPDGVSIPSHAESVLPIRFPIMMSPAEIRQPGFIRVRAQVGDRLYKLGSLVVSPASMFEDETGHSDQHNR